MSRPKSASDDLILTAARNAFMARGHGVSTRQIAADVRLSQPALIQRFGSKKQLFLAAMTPAPLDAAWIIDGESDESLLKPKARLFCILIRLQEQLAERAPRLLLLDQNPDVTATEIEDAHKRIGVPALNDALRKQISEWLSGPAGDAEHRASQMVDAMLLAAHGATFMAMAGAPAALVRRDLENFCACLDFPDDEEPMR